jgi:AcrR family transcriptional regulator
VPRTMNAVANRPELDVSDSAVATAAGPEPGLRERKRAKLRSMLVQVADKLFVERGFENVTLNEVADTCEVSVRTILRYFDSKEALALAPEYDSLEDFRTGLQNLKGDTLGYWRYHVGRSVAEIAANPEWHRQRRAMVEKVPTLKARLAAIHSEFQQLLAARLMEETGGQDRLGPRLLAAILMTGNEAVAHDWLTGKTPFDANAILETVDYAVDLFEGRLNLGASSGKKRTRTGNRPKS